MKYFLFITTFFLCFFIINAQEARLVLPIGHTDDVIGYKITPNERYLITASKDGTGKIWNYRTGKFMYDLKLHTNILTGIEMSNDGSFVVLASADGTYSKWDVVSGKLLFHSAPKASINEIFLLRGDSTVLLVKDYVMVIGHLKKGEPDILFDEIYEYYNDDKVKSVAISPSFETIALHQKNHPIKIFSLIDGSYKNTLERVYIDSSRYYDLTKQTPDFLYFSANNELVGSFNGGMMAGFKIDTKEQTFFYPKSISRYKLNNDCSFMAFTNGRDDTVRIWDTKLKKITKKIANENGLKMATFSDATSNLVLQKNRTVQEWSVSGKLINERELEEPIPSVISINNKGTIAVSILENGLQTIDWQTGKTINEFIGKITAVDHALVSKDGQWLFEVKKMYSNYWNLKQMNATRFPEQNEESLKNIFLTSINGMVILQYPSSFSLFDCNTGKNIYTRDGNQILMLNGDSTLMTINNKHVKKWTVATGETIKEWEMPRRVNNAAVSNNDSLLAYNTEERNNDSILVWNLTENKMVTSFIRPSQNIEGGYFVVYTPNYTPAFRFSNDNKYIFFSSGETGWLSIAKLPYEEYNKYDDLVDTSSFELDIIHQEGTLQFFSKYNPIAIIEKKKIVLVSTDNEVGDDEVKGYNYEKGDTDFRLEYPGFQKIIFYDSIKNNLFTATKSEFLEWDLGKQTLIKKWLLPTGMTAKAVIEKKDQLLIVSNDRIGIMPMDSTKPTYFFSTLDENEIAVVRNDRYYKVTPNAAANLSWNIGQKFYDFDQWDLQYNRPDKILELAEAKESKLTPAYYKAYLKRLKKNGLTEESFNQTVKLPETIIINNIANGEFLTDAAFVLKIKVIPSNKKAAIKKLFVLINGNPVFGKEGYETTVTKEMVMELPVTLSENLNNIKVSCMDINGNESIREQLQIVYKPAASQIKQLHFIGIGINQFANAVYNLSWSVKDIRDLAVKLKSKYPNIIIDTLFDSNVTKENILALKQKLLLLNEDDKVIVSYSGHGVLSKDFDYYLSTYSINFNTPEEKGLAYDDLESLLDNIKPRQKLMLIDACHSGEVDKDEIAKIEASKKELNNNGITTKSSIKVVPKKNLGMANSFELMQSLFVNVGKGTGATIISAAGGMQYAQERGDLKNGVFTYSIIEAFNNNPSLKVSELKKIVGARVTQLTNGLQKPTSRNETNNYDWVIW